MKAVDEQSHRFLNKYFIAKPMYSCCVRFYVRESLFSECRFHMDADCKPAKPLSKVLNGIDLQVETWTYTTDWNGHKLLDPPGERVPLTTCSKGECHTLLGFV